jgi:hypothetical protein
MKHIKLFEEFINEGLSMEAVYIHQIIGCGQEGVQNFIDDNNIDAKKLADYVKQHKDSKEKYDVRDMIKDPNSNKKLLKQFLIEGSHVNEDLSATVSDPEVEAAWEKIYGHSLKHDHASIFKILKQRPHIDSKELDRIWSESFDKTFKEQHPRVWDILFSDKDKTN